MGLCGLLLLTAACAGTGSESDTVEGTVVDVVARGLTFEAPDSVPAGWTTFRFTNESAMTHFVLVERLPDGIGIARQQDEVAPVFQEGMNQLAAGDPEAAMETFGALPEWFGQVVFLGGPGLLAPGRTAEAAVYLEPGTYLLECYVKTGGVFHSYNADPARYGMVHELTVTGPPADTTAPEAAMELTLSSRRGIEVAGNPSPGEHVVAVHFEDQTTHENFVGHDVHLARLPDTTDLAPMAAWMDWTRPGGLETPAPVEFVGGINEMPAGTTGYFTIHLEPGWYAWVAEVPDPARKGMLQVFRVPAETGNGTDIGRDRHPPPIEREAAVPGTDVPRGSVRGS
jgi:hypothetical protein